MYASAGEVHMVSLQPWPVTFDLWPWKAFPQCPLRWQILVASFTEIAPLSRDITSRKMGLTTTTTHRLTHWTDNILSVSHLLFKMLKERWGVEHFLVQSTFFNVFNHGDSMWSMKTVVASLDTSSVINFRNFHDQLHDYLFSCNSLSIWCAPDYLLPL